MGVRITMEFTDELWAELYYAVESKLSDVSDGRYGEERSKQWSADLKDLRDSIALYLHDERVSF